PFSVLSYRNAYAAFLGVNLVLLCASYRFLAGFLRNLSNIWAWFPALMFTAFYPVPIALMQGQDSILLLTILAAAFSFMNNGRELTAGVILGLGLFKFQIVLPIAFLYLVWRRWRVFFGFALSGVLAAYLSVALVGVA